MTMGVPAVDGYGPDDWERLGVRDGQTDPRSPFGLDYDRLIYTAAFRRLQGKTQVVSPGEADFFRTRLTHTIEVAQVARRLAETLNRSATTTRARAGVGQRIDDQEQVTDLGPSCQKIDPDCCEASAVLHDLGHPPFGHAGESALAEAVTLVGRAWGIGETGSFNGNAQSFRLAAKVLGHKQPMGGLQLTRAVLDAALKYPWTAADAGAPDPSKWSVNPTELEELRWVRAPAPAELRYAQSIEAQIMDWADDVAYTVHDLDDWSRAGWMPLAQLATDSGALNGLAEWIAERWERKGQLDGLSADDVHGRVLQLFQGREQAFQEFRNRHHDGEAVFDPSSDAARRAFRVMRSILFDEFTTAGRIVEREGAPPGAPRRYRYAFVVDGDARLRNRILKELLWRYVVGDVRMATQQTGQQRAVRQLFLLHTRALRHGNLSIFPSESQAALKAAGGDWLESLRIVVDWVGGMTDAFAASRHARLTGPGARLQDYS